MVKTRVLITGITGMVGSHLAEFLLEKTNWDIYGMVRWRSPLDNIQSLIPRINEKDRVFLLYGDLNDHSSLIDVIKKSNPHYVYHLAAQSFPRTSFEEPIITLETNIIGTMRLLEALKENSREAIVHVCSSSEVYGRVSKDKLPIKEDCNFHPASPYAISKIGTDVIGRFFAEAYEMTVLTTRMFTHTGPRRGDVFAESTFAKQIALIEADIISPIVYTGNLKSLRTYTDVRDAVNAYYLLLTKNPIAGECYNIGGTYTCTIGEMLEMLISLSTVKNIKIATDPERLRPIDADLQVPDISKFQEHTGWKPEVSFQNSMQDLLNYWRDQIQSGKKFLNR
jgi:GDP-mannose 4,6-dehydratase